MTMLTADPVAAADPAPAAVVADPVVVADPAKVAADAEAAKVAEVKATADAETARVAAEVKIAETATQKHIAEQTKTITDLHTQWRADVAADKEIGGDKLAENLAAASAAMRATSTPQLIVLLEKSGLGNHPEVIRHFLKIAPAFAEGKHVPGGTAPAGDSRSQAKVLYPNAP